MTVEKKFLYKISSSYVPRLLLPKGKKILKNLNASKGSTVSKFVLRAYLGENVSPQSCMFAVIHFDDNKISSGSVDLKNFLTEEEKIFFIIDPAAATHTFTVILQFEVLDDGN